MKPRNLSIFKQFRSSVSKVSIRRKSAIVLSIPLITLSTSAFVFSYAERKSELAEAWVTHTLQVETAVYQLTLSVLSAQSAVRDDETTDARALPKYQNARRNLSALLARVETATIDNPEQNARVKRLRSALGDMLARLDAAPANPRNAPHQVTYDQWVARRGIQMDNIVRMVGSILREEEILLKTRTAEANRTRETFNIAMQASFGFGFLGTLVAAGLFTEGIIRRIQELEKNSIRLQQGLPFTPVRYGGDEIGRLAMAMERASSMLSERDERLKLALETAGTVIWEVQPNSGDIRYEGKLVDSLGDPSDASGSECRALPANIREFFEVIHPAERPAVEREFARMLSGEAGFRREVQMAGAQGCSRTIAVVARRHSRSADGAVVLGTLMDISEMRRSERVRLRQAEDLARSERSLREQTRILRSVLDSMADAVIVADKSGRFLLFNPAAERIVGPGQVDGERGEWTPQFGLFLADGVTPAPGADLPLSRALAGESVDGMSLFVRNPNVPQGLWISATSRPLKNEDGVIWGAVVVFGDVSERKGAADALRAAKDEAEAANRAKSEFLSRMSHELRTPLNSVIGFSQILKMHDLGERPLECTEHILKAGNHLLGLIDEVLDISRIEAGKLPISAEPVLVSDAVNEAVEMVRPLADARGIAISVNCATCRQHVRADRQRLKQVLLNLLSNAVKYNNENGRVSVMCKGGAPGTLRLNVADTGNGISEADQDRLFVPFQRLAAADTQVEGTGLGLALSRRLVEVMGGTIGVESAPGNGSTFWIELQKTDPPQSVVVQQSVATSADLTRIETVRTVLYIEDNLANLRLMEHIVRYRPHIRLIPAMQGRLGLELARQHAPDLILSDLHLPDVSGREVLASLQSDPLTSRIPVIIISADATPGQLERLVRAGAAGYLTKPLNVETMLKAFDDHLIDKTIEISSVEKNGAGKPRETEPVTC